MVNHTLYLSLWYGHLCLKKKIMNKKKINPKLKLCSKNKVKMCFKVFLLKLINIRDKRKIEKSQSNIIVRKMSFSYDGLVSWRAKTVIKASPSMQKCCWSVFILTKNFWSQSKCLINTSFWVVGNVSIWIKHLDRT